MPNDLSAAFWGFYANNDYVPVLQICELVKDLELLESSAEVQSAQTPDCPACEAWAGMILPVYSFLQEFPASTSAPTREQLNKIWLMANELSDKAFHCHDALIFYSPEWSGLRSAASKALHLIGLPELRDHIDGIALECRKALYPPAHHRNT